MSNVLIETSTSAPDQREPRENYFVLKVMRGEPREVPANGTDDGQG